MPKYLFTGTYSAEGARGLLKEGGSGRREATEKFVKSLGGTVEAYYFAFGSDDFYLWRLASSAIPAGLGSSQLGRNPATHSADLPNGVRGPEGVRPRTRGCWPD